MEAYKTILSKYIPQAAIDPIYDWLKENRIHLRISRARTTKLGDYRSPHNGKGHQITVNHNLNPYAFLITLVHEIAHQQVWIKHGNRVKAHGREWKDTYRKLMDPFIDSGVFPDDVKQALIRYMGKSYASSGTDLNLSRVLQRYDAEPGLTLEQIREGSTFRIPGGKTFIKGSLNRKRYRCIRTDNNRVYLVSALAQVELLKSP